MAIEFRLGILAGIATLVACGPGGAAADQGGQDSGSSGDTGGVIPTSTDPSAAGPDSSDGTPAPTDEGSTTAAPDPSTSTSTSTSEGGSSGSESSTGEADVACGALDLLFVVDNSASMQQYQSTFVAGFPAFIEGLLAELPADIDLHLGVITTDAYAFNAAGCTDLGGLVVQTGGLESSQSACGPYAEGFNYMTSADDLPMTFECAARVGTSGSGIELPMQAMQTALGAAPYDAPTPCNDGFLRDDATLGVVVLSNEWDGPNDPEIQGSAGTPADWYESLVALRAGNSEAISVLSILHAEGGTCPPENPAFDGVHLVELTEMFGDQGVVAGICEADFGPAYEQFAAALVQSCNTAFD